MQESKAFIALLNAGTATPKHWANILPPGERELRRFYPTQSQEAQQLLCQHVNEWIASGFQAGGSEMPECRSYQTWGCQAIFEAMEGLLNCDLTIPEKGIFGLQANRHECPHPRGLLSVRFNPRGGIEAAPIVFREQLRPNELAAYGFFLLWQSPWLFEIMRCAHCGIFAIPARKPRKEYKRGWHCEQHRNTASATAATAETRKAIRERWFGRAIAAWLEYEQQPRRVGNDRVRFIKDRVNDGLPALHRIKRNTITRNLKEIQAAAEGRKQNAKG